MRILHALSQTELTGSEVYAFELAQHQSQQGHEIYAISDNFHKEFPGVRVSIPLSTKSFWKRMDNILALRRILKKEKIEIIHCHSRGACRHLYWASRGLGIPVITTVHGYQHNSFSKKTFDIFGDYVFAVCESIYNQQVQQFHRDKDSIEVLRNPVSIPKFRPTESHPPTILLAGRNSGPKGDNLKSLVRDFASSWLSLIPNLRIRLILSGIGSHELEQLKRIFPAQVEIQGSVTDLPREVSQSDIVVGAGRIAIEALLLGKTVVGLGESEAFGLITADNWREGLKHNFGDVGLDWVRAENLKRVSDQILACFKLKEFPSLPKDLIEAEYNPLTINDRMIEVYRSERIRKKMGWLPILMYHKVIDDKRDGQHRIFIHKDNFRSHIEFLKKKNFQFLSFKDLDDFWMERRPLSELSRKSLIITFDDGYTNNLEHAIPVLKENRAKATIFLLADHSILSNSWDEGSEETPDSLMSLEEKKSLSPDVIEIGSHGLRHDRLPKKDDSEILSEMRVSKKILEHDLNRPVTAFAYAFGDIDSRLPRLAKEAGYAFAVNTDRGPVEWSRNPWSLFRVSMFPEDNVWSLWKKTSKWYRKYYYYKRGL